MSTFVLPDAADVNARPATPSVTAGSSNLYRYAVEPPTSILTSAFVVTPANNTDTSSNVG